MRIQVVVSLLLLLVSVVRAADLPPAVDAHVTEADMHRVILNWCTQNYVKAYDAVGSHDPTWDDQVRTLLANVCKRVADEACPGVNPPNADTSAAALHKLAATIAHAGCNDPLFQYLNATFQRDTGDKRSFASGMKNAAPLLLASNYPPGLKWDCALAFWNLAARPNTTALADQMQKSATQAFADYLRSVNADPLERRMKIDDFEQAASKFTPDSRAKLIQLLAQAPAIDDWTLHMVRGIDQRELAWEARGNGAANTVSDQQGLQFQQHLNLATEELVAAYKIDPSLPEAATEMITVSMGLGGDPTIVHKQLHGWFDRATGAQIDFAKAWRQLLLANRPRWYGSLAAMYAIGCEAADTKRFDTAVPAMLFTALLEIAHDTFGNGGLDDYELFKSEGVWTHVESVFDGYRSKSVPGYSADDSKTLEMAFAFRCGQYAPAIKLLEAMNGHASRDVLAKLDIDTVDQITLQGYAMTSDRKPELLSASKLENAGKLAEAATAFDHINDQLKSSHPAWLFVQQRRLVDNFLAALQSGVPATVPTTHEEDQSIWTGDLKHWQFADDGLSIQLPRNSRTLLDLLAPLVPNAHRVITFEWSYSNPAPSQHVQFVVDFRSLGMPYGHNLSLIATPSENHIHIATANGTVAHHDNITIAPDSWHKWVVDENGPTLSVTADDQKIFDAIPSEFFSFGRPTLGFEFLSGKDGATLHVRNLTIQNAQLKAKVDAQPGSPSN